MSKRKIKVVIVDDSALIRSLLKEIINREPDMEVVGIAPDPLVARELIRAHDPDVITLDVEMPRMDGLSFLERLMRLRPTPVLMISTLTAQGSETALRALEIGAVDIIAKPRIDVQHGMEAYAEEIVAKLRIAARAKIRRADGASPATRISGQAMAGNVRDRLLVLGASTGGTEALKDVLVQLPPNSPGIVIAQHMPEGFTRSFAARLDSLCSIRVKEAQHGERIQPGHAYIAPGDFHLTVARTGGGYDCLLDQSEKVSRHRPSVDVLFNSAARSAGKHAIGVILTGMGKDGALGMLEMHRVGAWTIAQDEASCVVFGMPKEAIAAGGVDEVVPLKDIPAHIFARL